MRLTVFRGIGSQIHETFTDTDKFSQRIGGGGVVTLATLGFSKFIQGVRAARSASIAANSAGRTFYTVQNEANAARLLSGGTPWPASATKAHLGEGLYTWGSRSQAEAYMSLLEGRGASGLRIMEASIPEAQYNTLRAIDLRGLGDNAADAWLGRHSSLFGEGVPHGLDHVIRDTGNFGPEFFFSRYAFPLLNLQ